MRRLASYVSKNKPLFFQAVAAIEANNSNNNDNDQQQQQQPRRVETDLQELRVHLLALGKTGSRLSALSGNGATSAATALVNPDEASAEDAAELPEAQQEDVVNVLAVS